MPDLTVEEFLEHIQTLLAEAAYAEAFERLTEGLTRYPDAVRHLDYYRLCAAARLGNLDFVYATLKRQLAENFWYTEALLRQTPSLQPLQGTPEFETLVQENIALQAQDQTGEAAHVIAQPEGAGPWPTLVALHGNSGAAVAEAASWEPAVTRGWRLAMPESSQMGFWKGMSNWDDEALAFEEIAAFYKRLPAGADLVLGGFSMGGRVALRAALSGLLPAQGFIVLSPYIFDALDEWDALIAQAEGRALRGYIMVNADDPNYGNIHALHEALNARGIPCGFETFPGEHMYPAGFTEGLLRGLEFVRQA